MAESTIDENEENIIRQEIGCNFDIRFNLTPGSTADFILKTKFDNIKKLPIIWNNKVSTSFECSHQSENTENKNIIVPPEAEKVEHVIKDKIACPVCYESVFNLKPTATPCGHLFCRKCIVECYFTSGRCPKCNCVFKFPELCSLNL